MTTRTTQNDLHDPTPQVLDEILEKFDANRNGTIEYNEFVGTLFPVLSRGYKE